MNRRSPLVMMLLVALAVALSGCGGTKQMGSLSVSTHARTDAKGPWSDAVVVVNGYGFPPHKRIDLKFNNLPVDAATSHHSWRTNELLAPRTDANGSFSFSVSVKSSTTPVASWSRYIGSFPPLDYYADPTTDVTVTAREHMGSGMATATIKAGDLIAAPYSGAPADTTKAAQASTQAQGK